VSRLHGRKVVEDAGRDRHRVDLAQNACESGEVAVEIGGRERRAARHPRHHHGRRVGVLAARVGSDQPGHGQRGIADHSECRDLVLDDADVGSEVDARPPAEHERVARARPVLDVHRVHDRRPRVAEPPHARDARARPDQARDPRERALGRAAPHLGGNLHWREPSGRFGG
jgi:hypothetical protein